MAGRGPGGTPDCARQRPHIAVTRELTVGELAYPAERLRRWLGREGLTSAELGRRMGVTAHAVSMLWQRPSITEPVFLRLCAAMGVEPSWWSEPHVRYRRPRRGALQRRIEKEAEGLSRRLKMSCATP